MERNDGTKFEGAVLQLVRAMGFEALSTKASGDGGIDIVAYNDQPLTRGKYVIQCKDWTNPVGEPVVRDLYGAMMSEGANKGIIITTSVFTDNAVSFAMGKPLELIDGSSYTRLCEENGIRAGQQLETPAPSIPLGSLRLIGFRVENERLTYDDEKDITEFGESFLGETGTLDISKERFSFAGDCSAFSKSLKPTSHSITAVSVDVSPHDIAVGKKHPDQGNGIVGIRYKRNWMVEGETKPLSMWLFFEGDPTTVGKAFADADGQMGTKPMGKQCFVATVVYGDNECSQVEALRQWRDNRLRKTALGREFINYYYRHGPTMAAYVSRHPCVSKFIKSCLNVLAQALRWNV